MIEKFVSQFTNERGNIALFVLGILSIMMVLFILIINLGGALAVKEKSATTAQQASMAASSVVYEEVRNAINDYEDDTLEGVILAFFEDFNEKVDDKKTLLSSSDVYNGWSENEIELEAFDLVLDEELDEPSVRHKLKLLLHQDNFESEVIEMAKDAIKKNGGKLAGATLKIYNDRIHIRASNVMDSVSLASVVDEFSENVYQESAGPKIDFLEEIWDWNTVIALD